MGGRGLAERGLNGCTSSEEGLGRQDCSVNLRQSQLSSSLHRTDCSRSGTCRISIVHADESKRGDAVGACQQWTELSQLYTKNLYSARDRGFHVGARCGLHSMFVWLAET